MHGFEKKAKECVAETSNSEEVKVSPRSEYLCFIFIFPFFLQLHLWHLKVSGLGVDSELQLRPTPQPQQQHQIFNPLSEARD